MRRCRNEADRDAVRQEIAYILQRILEDLLKGFLVVPLRNDNEIWSAAIVTVDRNATIGPGPCPDGSYRDGDSGLCSK